MRQVVGRALLTEGRQSCSAVLHIGEAKLRYEAAGAQHAQSVLMIALLGLADGAQNFVF